MKTIFQSLRILAMLTLLTGFIYPLVVTDISHLAFPSTSSGSLEKQAGRVIGSSLLAQKTESARYFWPRPSGANFATVASGASNQAPTSDALRKAVSERREKLGADAPEEMLTSSGSGLDPHLSPAAARYQATRIATERKVAAEKVNALIDEFTEGPQFGILGEARVNVLALNRALDATR
jgi:potassium-transporting ATPase KdpC subunit